MAASERGSAKDVVRRFHRAFNERDASGLLACLREGVRWHVAGAHPFAGEFAGRQSVWADHYEPLWPSPARVEPGEVLVHGEYAVALTRAVHNFGDGPRAWDIVEVFRLADAGIAERWEFTSGQAELDALLLRGCAAAAGTGDPGEQHASG